MKKIAYLANSGPRPEIALPPATGTAARFEGASVVSDMIGGLALAPSAAALWAELRALCLYMGCPAIAVVDMSGTGSTSETFATSFALHFDLDELRQDLANAAGSPFMVDRQTLALPAFGLHGVETMLIARLSVPESTVPTWAEQLALAYQLAYARYRQLTPRAQNREPLLSEREREIMLWVTRGKSNNVIGSILGISASTVDTYMRRIFRKLDVADRTSAAMRALAIGAIA